MAAHDLSAWFTTTSFVGGEGADVEPYTEAEEEVPAAEASNPTLDSPEDPTSAHGVADDSNCNSTPTSSGGAGPAVENDAADGKASPDRVRSTKMLKMSQTREDDFVMVEDHFDARTRSPAPLLDETVDDLLLKDERLSDSISPHKSIADYSPLEQVCKFSLSTVAFRSLLHGVQLFV
jgi:hypothetical protein